MKRRIGPAILAVSVMALATACSSGASSNTAQYAHPNDPSTWLANADKEWAADVENATDGDVSINIHWSGALAAAPEAADAMGSGTSQIGILYPIYTPAKFPTWAWLSEYSFLSDPRPVIGDMQAYAAALEVSLNSDLLMDEYRDQGIEPILPLFEMNAGYHLVCTEPVTSLDDAKGKTVRTPGGPWERETTALGMAPTQMGVGEMYEALQRGVLDCSVNPLRDMVAFDLIEVATDITMDDEVGFTGFNAALGANGGWWDGLGAETQDEIWTTLKDYSERFVASGLGADLEIREKIDEYDVKIHEMDPDMREALKENQDQRMDAALSNAPDGSKEQYKELLTAYTEAMEKWDQIITDELGYGEKIPATWSEIIASDMTIDDIDFGPFSERLWDEVLEPAMPSNR
ncbi:TRAP transporter substrate-binding protein DctP [Microbacterium sp. MPKO10]|uniref:TRAP transporter substrate-binding protein DctP n=1 Tax=Microbacterium sp. MPKO10 TaxID=2989818 RepID=UPI0022363BCA|nr:TRAP transporter substrate-binding protein DctP [Microbacterium sp. MPKO10]MCW4458650.1 TRAP transporter substrate-binding protein DctP [Microbacterium sp. MPKO10]